MNSREILEQKKAEHRALVKSLQGFRTVCVPSMMDKVEKDECFEKIVNRVVEVRETKKMLIMSKIREFFNRFKVTRVAVEQ